MSLPRRNSKGQFIKGSGGGGKKKGKGKGGRKNKRYRRREDYGGLGNLSMHIPKGLMSAEDPFKYLQYRNQAASAIGEMKKNIALDRLKAAEMKHIEDYEKKQKAINQQKQLLERMGKMFAFQ